MADDLPTVDVRDLTPRGSTAGCLVFGYDVTLDQWVVFLPSALTGAQGPKGDKGDPGQQGAQGIPGTPGANGSTVRNGNGAPNNSIGQNGDWYIDKVNRVMYGPKADGAWPTPGFSVIGPQGAQGIPGPAGADGGGGGSGLVVAGTIDGQGLEWDGTQGLYTPVTGAPITADHDQTVEINTPTALTYAAHNRRNISVIALAALTLAATEAGTAPNQGMSFVLHNDHSAVNQITFGAGFTVKQPSTGTGTGGVVKVAIGGMISVLIYPSNSALIAKVRGDVA